jgi:hypothetical protein
MSKSNLTELSFYKKGTKKLISKETYSLRQRFNYNEKDESKCLNELFEWLFRIEPTTPCSFCTVWYDPKRYEKGLKTNRQNIKDEDGLHRMYVTLFFNFRKK